ncbi:hypothetical protein D910_05033 [Dendroctonus ponderosae]|uniref:F-box domain-containing protein n=1 Tax=Dendroctonus ponderosae TaxID=77166 RepID=U4U3K1_DENPD|nr:hypothetical protein D910_05033 [Dendroctonus ponderosae]
MAQQDVLQQLDVNVDHSPVRKRARFDDPSLDENKRSVWSLTNRDVILDEVYDHGIGRLDCDFDDLPLEGDTIFNGHQPKGVDVSCASMTPDTRGKHVAVLGSTLPKDAYDKFSVGEWSDLLVTKTVVQTTDKINYFDLLSDEVILQVFRWLPKSNLKDVALCCKRFYRLSEDESLWTRMDLAGKHLKSGQLGIVLSKQVVVLRLARSEVRHSLNQRIESAPYFKVSNQIMDVTIQPGCQAFEADFQSRLLYLDLSMACIASDSLVVLFNKCRRLKKLSLENVRVNDSVLLALSANKDIEVINFAMCSGIRVDGLEHLLSNCKQITELNIAWTYLSSNSIKYICENLSPTMDRLNFSGCRKLMTDRYVASLVSSCPKLRELDLSDCTVITGESIKQITILNKLTFVALSRCYFIPYKAISMLKKLPNLLYLDIHGGYIEATELKEIQKDLGNSVQINQFKFSSIARPTVGVHRSSIWNMRVRE